MKTHHFGIEVSDIEKSISFYETFLDLHRIKNVEFLNEEIVFLIGEGFQIELVKTDDTITRTRAHLAFEVTDLMMTINGYKEKDFQPIEGPYFLKNGWKTAFYEGPNGEIIEFIQEN
ncbi:VOC family protein [Heyndrickxia sp. NPDC080065]|uniref:VOC family protein n=1 Tax=Heyndrickxia sp. NPDC080065 TaxID=3390568 RepID=UPI003D004AE3